MLDRSPRASRRVFAIAFVVAVLVALLPSSATAHENCAGDANGPYKYNNGNRIKGKVSYLCTLQHDKYEVKGCLQKKVSGTWTDKHCLWLVIGPNLSGVTGVFVEPNEACSAGDWRTVFLLGTAWNESGQVAHQQTINEQSPVVTITSCLQA